MASWAKDLPNVGVSLDELGDATVAHGKAAADLLTIDDIDPDLAWVEREIRKCEDGPRSVHQDTPEMARLRNDRLARLKAMRARLLGEEPS